MTGREQPPGRHQHPGSYRLTRAAATGDQAKLIGEARSRIEFVASLLARAQLGDVDLAEIADYLLVIAERAGHLIDAAGPGEP